MTHLSRRALLRFDDSGEGGDRRRHAKHLIACRACQERRTRLQNIRRAAREVTSPAAPDVFAAVLRQLAEGPPVILPLPSADPAAGSKRPWKAVVSTMAFVVLATAAAAAAVTLHPFGLWKAPAVDDAPAVTPAAADQVDVDMKVGAAGLTVMLESPGEELQVQVGFGERTLLRLTLEGGVDASLRTGATRVTVSVAGGGRLALMVPRDAPPVRLVADGVTVAVVREGMVRTPGRSPARELDEPLSALMARARGNGGP